jgi:hypothetical protein
LSGFRIRVILTSVDELGRPIITLIFRCYTEFIQFLPSVFISTCQWTHLCMVLFGMFVDWFNFFKYTHSDHLFLDSVSLNIGSFRSLVSCQTWQYTFQGVGPFYLGYQIVSRMELFISFFYYFKPHGICSDVLCSLSGISNSCHLFIIQLS